MRLTPNHLRHNNGRWVDVQVRWELEPFVLTDLLLYSAQGAHDILIVPRDALNALIRLGHPAGKARSIVRVDRLKHIHSSMEFSLPSPFGN
jgi:hypothetical protein